MKIDHVKKIKSGKYKIIFDNDEALTTYDDVIINNGLLFHKEVDSDILDKLNIETKYYDIYNKTINFITKKMRSEKEVGQYLEKNNVLTFEKEQIIIKLKDIGLINDIYFAKAYTQDRFNLSSDGPDKIRRELEDNDISSEVIEESISNIGEEDLTKKIDKLISKRINNNKRLSNYMLKQKIIVDMINLGYNRDMIIISLDNLLKEDTNIIKKEYDKIYKKLSSKYSEEELEKQVRCKLRQKGFTTEEINEI